MHPILTPTDLVALVNQTLEFAYPIIEVEGEVLNYKVSRGKWVYFDIADETAKVRCFGTVYMLPGPVEDGMRVRVIATPRLHPQFGFSLTVQSLQFSGEGTIKKASDLLFAQLDKEGLFASERKRTLPYPPKKVGLITSDESAAYKDFVKVLGARWSGLEITLANVQVQGDPAVSQIVRALEWFNKQADIPDVLVLIRGGGSADDLQAFSSEQVTRAVAASRIPTLVAIGHEQDVSLAELAADVRASTPSNAAELLVPDRREQTRALERSMLTLNDAVEIMLRERGEHVQDLLDRLSDGAKDAVETAQENLTSHRRTLEALSPRAILKRGYAVVRSGGKAVYKSKQVKAGDGLVIQLADGIIQTEVQ